MACSVQSYFRAQCATNAWRHRSQLFNPRSNSRPRIRDTAQFRGSFSALASAMLRVIRPAGKQSDSCSIASHDVAILNIPCRCSSGLHGAVSLGPAALPQSACGPPRPPLQQPEAVRARQSECARLTLDGAVPVYCLGSSGWAASRALQLPPKRLRGLPEMAGELRA